MPGRARVVRPRWHHQSGAELRSGFEIAQRLVYVGKRRHSRVQPPRERFRFFPLQLFEGPHGFSTGRQPTVHRAIDLEAQSPRIPQRCG
ncbi:hypothetical protein Raf01_98110 [Rugosimonospora africana]|uniref:Uncharacterized protein n=1 Tax=Rugosimonospora africana TaxID=556532 RepID=A0A8J3VX94_9ACTN|nr:hypothetical protein Raf01_98110 [Rugosimonospora africana]